MALAFTWDDGSALVASDGFVASRVDGSWSELKDPVKIGELDSGWRLVSDKAKAKALFKEAAHALSV